MESIHITAVAEADGEVRLSNLPVRKGDTVEAIVVVPEASSEDRRKRALEEFLELARSSTFCSAGPYPSREELHERS